MFLHLLQETKPVERLTKTCLAGLFIPHAVSDTRNRKCTSPIMVGQYAINSVCQSLSTRFLVFVVVPECIFDLCLRGRDVVHVG